LWAVEAGRDDRNPDLALHRRLMHSAEDDFCVLTHGVVDDFVDLVHFPEGQIGAAGDVDEDAGCSRHGDVVEEGAGDGLLGGFDGAILTAAFTSPVTLMRELMP